MPDFSPLSACSLEALEVHTFCSCWALHTVGLKCVGGPRQIEVGERSSYINRVMLLSSYFIQVIRGTIGGSQLKVHFT